jgi:two-component system, LytTR family, sensor histidine kinase AlgZ
MRASEPWLPDLCRLPRLATMFGVAELVVLVLALAPDGGAHWSVQRFVSASGFALWLALTIAVLLCAARRQLSRLPMALGSTAAVLAAALIALLGAAMLHQLDRSLGYGMIPRNVPLLTFASGSAAIAALITAVVLRYLFVIDGWQAQVRASSRAEADALQARIKPHFLFNSMNTIAGLVRHDPIVAERAVLDLSDLFRAALGAGESDSSLREEVELAERYLAIEALRLGTRLQVAWQRVEPLPWTLPLPRLILQPLLENAVLHGIARLPAGGCITIALHADPDRLRIAIGNPAPPPREDGSGAHHATSSIGHRLAYAFGPGARMTSQWHDGYYRCDLAIPLREDHGRTQAPADSSRSHPIERRKVPRG